LARSKLEKFSFKLIWR